MGLLYERYANPNELINRMLKTGRLCDFVKHVVKRKNEEAEKEEDNKLWLAYLSSNSSLTFAAWKNELVNGSQVEQRQQQYNGISNLSMSDAEVKTAYNNAKSILKNFKL